jgi:hypothetical protein
LIDLLEVAPIEGSEINGNFCEIPSPPLKKWSFSELSHFFVDTEIAYILILKCNI